MSVSCALVIGLENFPLRNHSLIAARSYVKPSVTEFKEVIKDANINKKMGKCGHAMTTERCISFTHDACCEGT